MEHTIDQQNQAKGAKPTKPRAVSARSWRHRWRRRLLLLVMVLLFGILGLWMAIHRIGWLGPWVADGLRAWIGTEAVTELERAAYSVQDAWDGIWRAGEKPRQYWDALPETPTPPSPAVSSGDPALAPAMASATLAPLPSVLPPSFQPQDVGPMDNANKTPADGRWVSLSDSRFPDEQPLAYKTLLHPDPRRPWSEVFVVAVDLSRTQLHYRLGAVDPKATTLEGKGVRRPALVPHDHWRSLVLAFNGGFKTEHRRYGVKVDGQFLVPARPGSCTVAMSADGLRIRTWEVLQHAHGEWLRQTPPCLCEEGAIHPGLQDETSRKWGSLFGDTVIRRSAVGLDRSGQTLFVAISNATTARVLASALLHAGAAHAAQLDVNWSYTKIVLFRPDASGELTATSLVEGFVVDDDEYLRQRSPKDFFYVVRR